MAMKGPMHRPGIRVPQNRSFERELAMLESMSGVTLDEAGVVRIRQSLSHPNNYLVAKAARLAAENNLLVLMPDLLAAFDRFFADPIKDDPQCWAKNAIAKALVQFECKDSAVFLRGFRHHQEEPVWGGVSDTAGALRGICTHALVACTDLREPELLDLLLESMVDADKTVQVEALRAIAHAGGTSANLLIKLTVLMRKGEPEVLGACFSALLKLDIHKAIPLVATFLVEGDDAESEAAIALAETHDPAALACLIARRHQGVDAWFGPVLDSAIALTRLPQALDFLLAAIESEPRHAVSALEAVSRVYSSNEVRLRVASAVARSGSERIELAFRQFFPERAGEA